MTFPTLSFYEEIILVWIRGHRLKDYSDGEI